MLQFCPVFLFPVFLYLQLINAFTFLLKDPQNCRKNLNKVIYVELGQVISVLSDGFTARITIRGLPTETEIKRIAVKYQWFLSSTFIPHCMCSTSA